MTTRATTTKANVPASVKRLQQRCAELQAEADRLRKELAFVREHRSELMRALAGPIFDEWAKEGIDEEALFAELDRFRSGKAQSIEDLIEELKAEGLKQCRPRKSRRTK